MSSSDLTLALKPIAPEPIGIEPIAPQPLATELLVVRARDGQRESFAEVLALG